MRSITFVVLVAWAVAMRCFFPYTVTNWAIMAVVVGVTILSGVLYAVQTWRHMGEYLRGRFGMVEWTALASMSLAFPAIYLAALQSNGVAAGIIIALLSVEFVTGGLYNFLTTAEKFADYVPPVAKTLLINAAGSLGLLFILAQVPGGERFFNGFSSLALAGSLAFCARGLYVHRRALLSISGLRG
jgi:phosphatidylglycerophosphate synthase